MEQIQTNSRKKGNEGEEIAIEYLKSLGYKIVKQNFHFGKVGEIDIICRDGNTLVFVEVKFRKSDIYGSAIDGMTKSQIISIRKVAEGYLYINKITDIECRFDFIGIDLIDGKPKITYLKNAF
ncbi:MAG: YraN family protein [Candidatus Kapabacteria bacterium]|nr:YraN family protein [Candidatus Kapabacteria bacterium]